MTDFQINIIKKRISEIIIFLFLFISCKNNSKNKEQLNTLKENSSDAVTIFNKHEKNIIWCDLDGDKKEDKVEIVINQKNDKSGLCEANRRCKKCRNHASPSDNVHRNWRKRIKCRRTSHHINTSRYHRRCVNQR